MPVWTMATAAAAANKLVSTATGHTAAMSSSTRPEPAAKRQKVVAEKKVALSDLPASQFSEKIKLFSGPEVTINVEGKDFILPKALLCYNSTFFDRAFNGFYREARLAMGDCLVEVFEVCIQWLYTSHVQLDNNTPVDNSGTWEEINKRAKTIEKKKSHNISVLVDFLSLADRIDLLGPFDPVYACLKEIVLSSRSLLLLEHIRKAAEFPAGHQLRQLFADAVVMDYARFVSDGGSSFRSNDFRYHKELEEVESFAADLMIVFNKCLRDRTRERTGSGRNAVERVYLRDPMDGVNFLFK